MGLPAARMGDAAGHAGTIIMGSPTVFIGGMPAARMGDPLVCPGFDGPKPHIIGNITMASTTVMIDGAFAARQGDFTGCGVAGVSGKGLPAVAGPPGVPGAFGNEANMDGDLKKDANGNTVNNEGFLYGQHSGYANEYGGQEQVKGSGYHAAGNTQLGNATASGSVDLFTASGEGHYGMGSGGVSAQGSVAAAQGALNTPDGQKVGASGGLLNAQAGVDAVLGTDGRRTGVVLGASAQASLAEGQIDSTSAYGIPFTDYSINVGASVGAAAGSIGAGAMGGAYHDAQDDRYHLTGKGDIKIWAGGSIGLDISFGKIQSGAGGGGGTPGIPVPLTPGTVILGHPTVLIG